MSELKLCPFCGSTAEIEYGTKNALCDKEDYPFARCSKCKGAWKPLNTWQNRPIEDALRVENERLKELNNNIVKYLKYFLDDAYEIMSVDPQFAGEAIIRTSVDVLAEIAEMIKNDE